MNRRDFLRGVAGSAALAVMPTGTLLRRLGRIRTPDELALAEIGKIAEQIGQVFSLLSVDLAEVPPITEADMLAMRHELLLRCHRDVPDVPWEWMEHPNCRCVPLGVDHDA